MTAMVFGFAPPMVARALPDAWAYAAPEDVLATRLDAVAQTLDRALPRSSGQPLTQLVELLERAAAACQFDGRPLSAGWAQVRRPDNAPGRLWLAATTLREHRGDGHVIAAVQAGLRGLDATLTHIATVATSRALIQPNRGWGDAEWEGSRR